ncbi:hypothetical protein [Litorimonas sp. WD9-15]|uniref:hypothetical protein n=1 Tax=Litorimonas sp. WD9-15 TaxID=3418716 RepID=UPI003D040199
MWKKQNIGLCLIFGMVLAPEWAAAQTNVMVLDTFIETHRIENVSANWETIALANAYTAPVVSCTYVLPSAASNEAHTRVRNVMPTSFEVRVQRFEDSSAFTASDVHCLVVETGAHTLSDGRKIEARTVLSDDTSGNAVGWTSTETENVTASLTSGFSSLAVFGQVMTFNDAQASVFWTNNCGNRNTPPTPTAFCVGKHIGMINDTRFNETLGYIVAEPGTGTVNGVTYVFARGGNSIAGTGNSPPYSYSISGDFETAILTQAAENGGNGGWAVLFGSDPLPNGSIQLAVEEETVAGDTSRRHINEEVYYSAFRSTQAAIFSGTKTVAMATDNPTIYAVPGSDVIYTITLDNTGTGPVDLNSLFLVDSVPDEMEFFTGDMGGGGPILFSPGTSGLSFSPSTDVAYSFASARPTNIGQCDKTEADLNASYDDQVRHICLVPKGYVRPGSLYPGNTASFSFRMKIP